MNEEDQINIIGIIPENSLKHVTTTNDLKRIVCDALGIAPIYNPLINDLQSKNKISGPLNEINEEDVVKSLYSNTFLTNCPNVSYQFLALTFV